MTFLGKGGKKILRDEIWAGMRFVFPLDHQYYKSMACTIFRSEV